MKEKKTEEGKYELGAYVGGAVLMWMFFLVTINLSLISISLKIINWEQLIYTLGVLIPLFLGLAILFTYDVIRLGNKLRKERGER